jgi:hypothetical protein
MHYNFIEIGTCDFETVVESCDDYQVGLCVEPVLHYLNKLPVRPRVHRVLAAVSDKDGFIDCFYIPEEIIMKHNMPGWMKGCTSVGGYHPTSVCVLISQGIPPEACFKKVSIPSYSVPTLFGMYQVDSCDYLKIDTEGHDCVILKSYIQGLDEMKYKPVRKIMFESNVLTPESDVDHVIAELEKRGYVLEMRNSDTILTYNG